MDMTLLSLLYGIHTTKLVRLTLSGCFPRIKPIRIVKIFISVQLLNSFDLKVLVLVLKRYRLFIVISS